VRTITYLNGRVYSYIRTPHLVLLGLLLAMSFAIALVTTIHLQSQNATLTSNWLLYDIPWFVTSLFVWFPAIQWIRYRTIYVRLSFEADNTSCMLDGDQFHGRWRVHKKSPRSMKSVRVLLPILSLLIIGMTVLDISSFYHAMGNSVIRFTNVEKVNAAQGLCDALMLMGLVTPLWSFCKYPFLVALRQDGRWLSVQCQIEK
jgi:uncharacterized membrane protein YjgN (DUF898 family)